MDSRGSGARGQLPALMVFVLLPKQKDKKYEH
jgi:hypothetical protein